MDLDGNGRRDVLSGSWPGELYRFAEQEDGSWERSVLTHANGSQINTGKASAVFVTDWDRDGDLDLITGEIGGKVFFVADESAADEPASFGAPVLLTADGEKMTGHHSGPCVADWDGDGRDDLLVGSGSGAVTLYRTTNDEGIPTLAAGVTLVAASTARGSSIGGATGAGSGQGTRVKITVADWNGDGHMDLLLGDFSSQSMPAPELTEEQQKDQAQLEARQAELSTAFREQMVRLQAVAKEKLGVEDPRALTTEERAEYNRKFRELMMADEDYASALAEMRAVGTKLRAYRPGREYRGYVWVCTRIAPAGTPETTEDAPGQE